MADKRLDNHLCSLAFLTFRLNYGWEKHDRRAEMKEDGKRQRKTNGKEDSSVLLQSILVKLKSQIVILHKFWATKF